MKDKSSIISNEGFQPMKKINFDNAKTVEADNWDLNFLRWDDDGFVVDKDPHNFGFGISKAQTGEVKSVKKIRKLPNKNQWKVYTETVGFMTEDDNE